MTPDRPRVDWLLVVVWAALLTCALASACGLLWLAGRIWRAVWPVLWPWIHANSDELTLGLGIAVVLGAVLVLALDAEGRR
jgi:hypothetical protein